VRQQLFKIEREMESQIKSLLEKVHKTQLEKREFETKNKILAAQLAVLQQNPQPRRAIDQSAEYGNTKYVQK
jgi:hypothetical protein